MDPKVNKYRKQLAQKHKVDQKFLDFIGAEDYGDLGKLYYYNIMDPDHEEYKSTKVVKENMDVTKRINVLLQENASDGIQAELERKSNNIKKELSYIKKIVGKLSRWTGAKEIEEDIIDVEKKIEGVMKKTDGLLDDMFDNLYWK